MRAFVLPFAAAASFFLGLSTGHADFGSISLHVDQSNKTEIDKTDRYTRTETRGLKLSISNASSSPADLKVKYTYFGREVKGNAVITINSGEQDVQAKPVGTETVDIPAATTTYTEEHFQTTGAKGKPGKKVDASGSKFIGYAVQIYQGGKMAAEAYEPMSMKDEVGKAGEAPKAVAPTKKK